MLKPSFLICTIFLLTLFKSQSQTISNIPLTIDKHHLNINYFPFDSILVLDNRFDTTKIYTDENGNYPPTYLNFSPSTSLAIKNYIDSAVKNFPRGDKKLLINIQQLRIPNKASFVHRRKKDSTLRVINLRDYILFSAELYYQTENNQYRKIVTINKNYYTWEYFMNSQFPIILDNIIEASCLNDSHNSILKKSKKFKYISEDTVSFNYSNDSSDVSIEEINQSAKNKWSLYQIIKKDSNTDGYYYTFDDFKNDAITFDSVQVKNNKTDSFYIVSLSYYNRKNKYFYPWAVRKNDTLFIQLSKNVYLKSTKLNNTFYFEVPNSLPDMYALLSIEAMRQESNTSGNSGNALADIISGAVSSTIDAIIKKSKENSIRKESSKTNFRKCFIDMTCGDFIY